MIILGTKLCHVCDEAEATLQNLDIEYEYVDLTESMDNLKQFLDFRDNHIEFNDARLNGKVGIPCFIFDYDNFTFSLNEAIKRSLQN